MSLLEEPSDLIAHFKLEACSFPTHTTQVCYTSTPGQGAREERVEKHWRKAKIVGEGGFGAVWLEERLENNVVKEQRALKEVSKARMKTAGIDVGREVLALARLSKHSPEFVKFYGWFEDERSIFLTMEYLPYGDLSQYIAADGIPEAESGLIASQILDGLIILHKYSFTHRDIKPSNIFVASPSPNWWVKIGDFGITKRVDNDRTAWRTEIGTRGFQAPEISGINGNMVGYTNLVDIWSLGCVLYNILAQELPFHRLADVENYCSGRSPFPKEALQGHNVSQCGISFLEKLLDPLPSERPTAEMARNASWFGEGPPALLVQVPQPLLFTVEYANIVAETPQVEFDRPFGFARTFLVTGDAAEDPQDGEPCISVSRLDRMIADEWDGLQGSRTLGRSLETLLDTEHFPERNAYWKKAHVYMYCPPCFQYLQTAMATAGSLRPPRWDLVVRFDERLAADQCSSQDNLTKLKELYEAFTDYASDWGVGPRRRPLGERQRDFTGMTGTCDLAWLEGRIFVLENGEEAPDEPPYSMQTYFKNHHVEIKCAGIFVYASPSSCNQLMNTLPLLPMRTNTRRGDVYRLNKVTGAERGAAAEALGTVRWKPSFIQRLG